MGFGQTVRLLLNRQGGVNLTAADVTAALGGTPVTNPMTTVGDLIVGGTAGAAQRLAAGPLNSVLTSGGPATLPSWQAASGGGSGFACAVAQSSVGQVISINTWTALVWDTNVVTTPGVAHSVSVNPGKFTVAATGTYRLTFSGIWTATFNAEMYLGYSVNAAAPNQFAFAHYPTVTTTATGSPVSWCASTFVNLNAGDTVTFNIYQAYGTMTLAATNIPNGQPTQVAVERVA